MHAMFRFHLVMLILSMLHTSLQGQLALHIEQPNTVLFGDDTTWNGNKLMWIPSKGAMVAGFANGSRWDYDNVGDYSVCFGSSTEAPGPQSFVCGVACKAEGGQSVAMGSATEAMNTFTVAMGRHSRAEGYNSTAMGLYTVASGQYSTAMGLYAKAVGHYSFAAGYGPDANGINSAAFGFATQADAFRSTAIGAYNIGGGSPDTWVPSDPIFEVGIGVDNDNRANALTVCKNGKVEVGKPGQGRKLLEFNSERKWAFVQYSTGSTTALKLQCDPSNNNKNFIIDTEGRIGINDNSPTYKLELPNMSANEDGQARAYDWDTYSDARVKKNVADISYGLAEVMQLRPVVYDHYSANIDHDTIRLGTEFEREIGFIAQEVFQLAPEAVEKPVDEDVDLWSISYARLIPVLTKAIQEQQQLIEKQQSELEELKLQLDLMRCQREKNRPDD